LAGRLSRFPPPPNPPRIIATIEKSITGRMIKVPGDS
jgi:hypothetical protein